MSHKSHTRTPGLAARHAIITPACRAGRGDDGAIEEALERCRKSLRSCLAGWPPEKGARFHVVVTVERPEGA